MTVEQGWRGGDGVEGQELWQAQLSGGNKSADEWLRCDAGGWLLETSRGWMLGQGAGDAAVAEAGSDDEDGDETAATPQSPGC